MSLSDVVPVEAVNEDNTKNDHESDDNEPPPLRERKGDDESSVDSSKSGSDIN